MNEWKAHISEQTLKFDQVNVTKFRAIVFFNNQCPS
jgi:hypothetical protein